MTPDYCLAYGFIIAIIVSTLKRIPFVNKQPKVVAGVIASVVAIVQMWYHPHGGFDYAAIAQCVTTQLAGSVLTYEAAKSAGFAGDRDSI